MAKTLNHLVGFCLRTPHLEEFQKFQNSVQIPWVEIVAENFIWDRGRSFEIIKEISQKTPIFLHSVGLNLGHPIGPTKEVLNGLKFLKNELNPKLISGHLCWSNTESFFSHDLYPTPFDEKHLNIYLDNINRVQDSIGEAIALENISRYIEPKGSTLGEIEFLHQILEKTNSTLLVDLNNFYVNYMNFHRDQNFLSWFEENVFQLPASRISQIHLAGFEELDGFLVDTHGSELLELHYLLAQLSLKNWGEIPLCIERDNHIPSFSKLFQEREDLLIQLESEPKRRQSDRAQFRG